MTLCKCSILRPQLVLLALGALLLSFGYGCIGAEVEGQNFPSLFIHLATGSFDPLSESGSPALPVELTLKAYPEDEVGDYIVQFKGPVLEKWKRALATAGVSIFDYVPQFAFIVRMDHESRQRIRTMEPVRWIGVYQPGYRIAPGLQASLSHKNEGTVELLVSVFEGEDVRRLAREIHRLGGETVDISETNKRFRLTIPSRKITDLASLTGVKWIERVPQIEILPSIQRKGEP